MLERRELVAGAGKIALGAGVIALASSGGMNLLSKAEAKGAPGPWSYKKIDPERVGEAAYQAWFEVFCSQAVAAGLFEQLREEVGEPWTSFPLGSLKFGMGGMLGWGVTCGAPVASSIVIGLAASPEVVNPMIHDLLQWYTETELPIYVPKKPRFRGEIIKTTAENPLCHVSVGRWMKAADRSFPSDERRDRCARLSADVAMKTAMMLNAWKDGKYARRDDTWNAIRSVRMPAQQNCTSCHGVNIPPTPPRAAR